VISSETPAFLAARANACSTSPGFSPRRNRKWDVRAGFDERDQSTPAVGDHQMHLEGLAECRRNCATRSGKKAGPD